MSKSNYGDKMTSEEVNEHLKYLAKQKDESGDGLPPLDVTDEERNLAKETMRTDMEKLLAVNLQCRERQLQASLLREKELKELMQSVFEMYEDQMPVFKQIKAAVMGE